MFKVGDRVQMDSKKMIKVLKTLPSWYTEDIYTIIEIKKNFLDDSNYQIVKINRKFFDDTGNITSQWLTSLR